MAVNVSLLREPWLLNRPQVPKGYDAHDFTVCAQGNRDPGYESGDSD